MKKDKSRVFNIAYSDQEKEFYYLELDRGATLQRQDFNDNYYLLFFLSGSANMVYESLSPFNIYSNSTVFLSPLCNYSIKIIQPVRLIAIGFNHSIYSCAKVAFRELSYICSMLKYEFRELDTHASILSFLDSLLRVSASGLSNKDFYSVKFRELFILFLAYYSPEEIAMFFYPLMGKNMDFRKMILENYSEAKSISEYAELCGYTPTVFQRKFKDVFGETVYQWMQRQKAEQIKHSLMTSDINPKELVEKFDFASPAHLNKFCKIWFGMTPSELQQTFFLRKKLK